MKINNLGLSIYRNNSLSMSHKAFDDYLSKRLSGDEYYRHHQNQWQISELQFDLKPKTQTISPIFSSTPLIEETNSTIPALIPIDTPKAQRFLQIKLKNIPHILGHNFKNKAINNCLINPSYTSIGYYSPQILNLPKKIYKKPYPVNYQVWPKTVIKPYYYRKCRKDLYLSIATYHLNDFGQLALKQWIYQYCNHQGIILKQLLFNGVLQ